MDVAYLLAVGAAVANAASNLLQRAANRKEPSSLSMRPGLILDLLRRPIWLAGIGAVIASFLLIATALGMGRLASIEPIVVLELPLTLIGAARMLGSKLRSREWAAVGAMTAGLAGLIGFLGPSRGTNGHAPAVDWAVAATATVGAIAVVVVLALRLRGTKRPALLGAATGMTFGLTSAFMKGMTASYQHGGIVATLTSWQTYAMIVSGLVAMFLLQNAFQAGRLVVVQPGITLADPVVAITWGVIVFRETTRPGVFVAAAIVSAMVMGFATVALARSPLLEAAGALKEGGPGASDRSGEAAHGDGEPAGVRATRNV